MSLLLLNLVYVNQADSERPGAGRGRGAGGGAGSCGGGVRGAANRRDGARGGGKNVAPFNFQQLISF